MEQIKLSLRIASIVVGLIVYCLVWKYIIDKFNDSTVFIIWIVLHIVGFVTAVVWAWC